jgi:hypothetical protein
MLASQYPDIIAKNLNVTESSSDGLVYKHVVYDICINNYNDVAAQVYNNKEISAELKMNNSISPNVYTIGTDLNKDKCGHFDAILPTMNAGDTVKIDLNVDSTNQVLESNENNNKTTQSFVY